VQIGCGGRNPAILLCTRRMYFMYGASTSYVFLRRRTVSGGVLPRWLQGSSHGTYSARLSSPTCRTIGGCVSVVSQLSDRPLACVDGGQRTGQWMVDRRQCGESDSHRFTWGVGPAAPDQPISGPWRSLTPPGIPSLPFLCAASWGRRCTCCPCIQVFSSDTKYPSTSKQDKKDKR
jgi:hypothetical protein